MTNFSKSYRRKANATLLAVGMLTGGVAVHELDNMSESRSARAAAIASQPACAVPVKPGEGPEAFKDRVSDTSGQNVRSEELKLLDRQGHVRTPDNTPDYWIAGSMGMTAEDTGVLPHLDQQRCEAIGGEVLKSMPTAEQNDHLASGK